MDIVLEFTDAFIADYAYAYLLPKQATPYDFPSTSSNITDRCARTFSLWAYKPASKYFPLEPSEAAYMSAWDRDNPIRQFITLYFITWSVLARKEWIRGEYYLPLPVPSLPPNYND